jgi:hypothetical protein
MILTNESLDYNKHCTIPFGAYVQANHEMNQTNSNAPRTIDAIYLRPANNQQGGHELMDLNSGKLITRSKAIQIPVTNIVIKAVEAMADRQGFKTLKFKNRNGIVFHDADWIAGVDYDENDDEEYNQDETYEDTEQDEDEELEGDIDQEEIEELLRDKRQRANPTEHQHKEQEEDRQDELDDTEENNVVSEQDTESHASEPRRSQRESRPVERLEPKMSGQSYVQKKKVPFAEDEWKKLDTNSTHE